MLTLQKCLKWIQSSTSELLRQTQAERDRLVRLVQHEQQILDDNSDHQPAVERYTEWITQHIIERDIAIVNVEVLERGVQNYIVGSACSRENIEYLTSFIYDISIQNGATDQRAKEAQLEILRLMGISALTFPIDMKTDAETVIIEQETIILSEQI